MKRKKIEVVDKEDGAIFGKLSSIIASKTPYYSNTIAADLYYPDTNGKKLENSVSELVLSVKRLQREERIVKRKKWISAGKRRR